MKHLCAAVLGCVVLAGCQPAGAPVHSGPPKAAQPDQTPGVRVSGYARFGVSVTN